MWILYQKCHLRNSLHGCSLLTLPNYLIFLNRRKFRCNIISSPDDQTLVSDFPLTNDTVMISSALELWVVFVFLQADHEEEYIK